MHLSYSLRPFFPDTNIATSLLLGGLAQDTTEYASNTTGRLHVFPALPALIVFVTAASCHEAAEHSALGGRR